MCLLHLTTPDLASALLVAAVAFAGGFAAGWLLRSRAERAPGK